METIGLTFLQMKYNIKFKLKEKPKTFYFKMMTSMV